MRLLLILLLAIVFKAQSQDFENKSLHFFIQHKHKFLVSDSDLIYLEPFAHKALPLGMFYNRLRWQEDSLIIPNSYSCIDSLLNNQTEDKYNLTHKESFIQNDSLFEQGI